MPVMLDNERTGSPSRALVFLGSRCCLRQRLDLDLHDRVGPAVHLRQQVASTADPRVMLYHAVLRKGGIALTRSRATGDADEVLARRDHVTEVLGVCLGSRVIGVRQMGCDLSNRAGEREGVGARETVVGAYQ